MGHALEMRGICKEFPGVKALTQVSLAVDRGEIMALVGENGAGKSTLMKVLSGFYPHGSYGGEIRIAGEVQEFHGIRDSERAGIAIIYQELALVRQLTVAENLFLGCEVANRAGVIDWGATYQRAAALLAEVGLAVSPDKRVGDCGVGEQQLVEIAKALGKNAQVLILDEPTAALTEAESERLLAILKRLRSRGVTCIYISHRLHEVLAIADRVTILRDGQAVETLPRQDVTEERMVNLMVGRELKERYPRVVRSKGEVIFEVRDWTVDDPESHRRVIDGVSFAVRRGEILGVAGLVGAGRSELAMSLFGVFGRVTKGTALLDGKILDLGTARKAIGAGVSLVSEDRKRSGLVLGMDVQHNITLANLKAVCRHWVIDQNEEVRCARDYVRDLRIKTPSVEQVVGHLSGGNQQKVVLAKWLMTKPRVLIVDEPTRGIDVGAKFEIYNILNGLVDEGVAVIIISSDLAEVLGMSDRIIVMHDGRMTGELPAAEANQEKIMRLATGVAAAESAAGLSAGFHQ